MFTVYKISNSSNEKVYYGATARSLNTRLIEHRSSGTFPSDVIDSCEIEALVYCESKSQMHDVEFMLIATNPNGYNIQGTARDIKLGNKQAGKWNALLKGHKVRCIEDNLVFASNREASLHYGCADSSINRALKKTGFIKSINKTFEKVR